MNQISVIVTGNYRAAVIDARERGIEIDTASMTGTDSDGNRFKILQPGMPDRLYGMRLKSVEYHPTAYSSHHYNEFKALADAMLGISDQLK